MKPLLLLPLCLCLVLSGCAAVQQVENQAFAVVLGLDTDGADGLEVILQIPKIEGQAQEDDSKSGDDFTIASARGANFTEALELISVSSPHRINLTQVKLVVVSQALARLPSFRALLRELAETYPLYASSYFAVCLTDVRTFIENQAPVFSPSVSGSLTALLEHHSSHGYIPTSTFADVYYLSNSVYSDPLAILAASAEEGAPETPAGETPADLLPGELPTDQESRNEYAGGAIFKGGVLAGTLNARQMVLVNLMRGRTEEFTLTLDGLGMTLLPKSRPRVRIGDLSPVLRISYEQTLTARPLSEPPDASELEALLTAEIEEIIAQCQALEVEPFGFAERAAGRFMTLTQWARYGWRLHFSRAAVDVSIHVELEDY